MELTFGQITEKPIPSGTQDEYDALVIEQAEDMEAVGIKRQTYLTFTHDAVITAGAIFNATIESDEITENSFIQVSIYNDDELPLVCVLNTQIEGEVKVAIYNIGSADTESDIVLNLTINN